MSCQIKAIGNFKDIATIRRVLFPTDDDRGSNSWLQSCLLSVCPTGETIVLANEKRLVVLAAVERGNSVTYDIVFSGCVDQDDAIGAVLCLPLAHTKSASVAFTCIVVGFESGFVRFYTKECQLLLAEQFHGERVISLKCQTCFNPQPTTYSSIQSDTISIHYPSALCKITGSTLYGVLRSNYKQISKEGDNFNPQIGIMLDESSFKKWGFDGSSSLINDCIEVDVTVRSSFDHLLTEMTFCNYTTGDLGNPTHEMTVIAVGAKPFIGYNFVPKEKSTLGLSNLAKVVASHFANKAKAALLPSWLGGKAEASDKAPSLASKPPYMMECRFGLCDSRTGSTIVLSHNRQLALVPDSLGRVFLIDAFRGTVMYIFKGYRDAQCAFVQSLEVQATDDKSYRKVANFIVIYAPRNGTIELFVAQTCKKIATFNATKFSMLSHIAYSLVDSGYIGKSYVVPHHCVLIDFDGSVKSVEIPFHYAALGDRESQKARDLYLLKDLKRLVLKANRDNNMLDNEIAQEVLKICEKIEGSDVHVNCWNLLIKWNRCSPDIVATYANFILHKYDVPSEKNESNEEFNMETNKLIVLTRILNNLVNVFSFIKKVPPSKHNDSIGEYHSELDLQAHMKNLEQLIILRHNSEITQKQIEEKAVVEVIEDKIKEKQDLYSFSAYLSTFDLTVETPISMAPELSNSLKQSISNFLFKQYIEGTRNDLTHLCECFSQFSLNVKDLVKCLLNCWLSRSDIDFENLQKSMKRLGDILLAILNIDKKMSFNENYDEQTAAFWLEIRVILTESTNVLLAFSAAIVCSYVIMNDIKKEDDELITCWENYTQEKCWWSYICSGLEEIAFLSIILSITLPVTDARYFSLPKLPRPRDEISLKKLVASGCGVYADLVAKWLTSAGVSPSYMALYEGHLSLSTEKAELEGEASDSEDEDEDEVPDRRFQQRLNAVGLDRSTIQSLCSAFSIYGIAKQQFHDNVSFELVLVNMAWEYANAWKGNLDKFAYMDAAWECLETLARFRLQIGLCHIIWKTHFKVMLISICKLFDSCGTLPTQTLCKQATDLTDTQIVVFLKHTTKCFNVILEAIHGMQWAKFEKEKRIDYLIDNTKNVMVNLAIQNSTVEVVMARIHFQLSCVLELMAKYPIVKCPKLIENLFDLNVGGKLFLELDRNYEDIDLDHPDGKTQNSRNEFLHSILLAAALEMDSPGDKTSVDRYKAVHRDVFKLLDEWCLDEDHIHEIHTYDLFTKGFDEIALEEMYKCKKRAQMSVELLSIATWKLYRLCVNSSRAPENISYFSCEMMVLVHKLKQRRKNWCKPGTVSTVEQMAQFVKKNNTQEMSDEYRFAVQILDACALILKFNPEYRT